MAEIRCLSYVVLGVSDLDAWEEFAESVLGMAIGARTDDFMTLRMDDYLQRFFLCRDDRDDLLAAGWEFSSHGELEAFVRDLRDGGTDVRALSDEEAQLRHVQRGFACDDPNGFKHEFIVGPALAPSDRPFKSKVLQSQFVTGDLGLGHILPFCKDKQTTVDFYTNKLKLRVSDYIRERVDANREVDATFFHTSTGRHHSIATAQASAPKTLNHFMIEVASIDDVGLAYDRTVAAGIPVMLELGHHPNDEMFSFYAMTPSGFAYEFGWGGIVIDDGNWSIKTYSQLSDWGHRRNPVN